MLLRVVAADVVGVVKLDSFVVAADSCSESDDDDDVVLSLKLLVVVEEENYCQYFQQHFCYLQQQKLAVEMQNAEGMRVVVSQCLVVDHRLKD